MFLVSCLLFDIHILTASCLVLVIAVWWFHSEDVLVLVVTHGVPSNKSAELSDPAAQCSEGRVCLAIR